MLFLFLLFSSSLSEYVDLSHPLNEDSTFWPIGGGLRYNVTDLAYTPGSGGGELYFSKNLKMAEHIGTHMDAPHHFSKNGWTVQQIPFKNLIAPVVKIDVREKTKVNSDYMLTVEDLEEWEKKNGPVPQGSVILMQTGWDQYYGNWVKYHGSTELLSSPSFNYTKWSTNLHFPGFSPALAKTLVGKVVGVGLDAASIDAGKTTDFKVHFTLQGANIYVLENLCCLEKVPEKGATILALPPAAEGASGFPVRVIVNTNKGSRMVQGSVFIFLLGLSISL